MLLLLELGFDAEERSRVVRGDAVVERRGVPLERAASKGSIEMARMLLERGADPNANPLRETPSHVRLKPDTLRPSAQAR